MALELLTQTAIESSISLAIPIANQMVGLPNIVGSCRKVLEDLLKSMKRFITRMVIGLTIALRIWNYGFVGSRLDNGRKTC
ncbi:hypothetical protein SEA_STIGMA_144 [Streptomyces phage Stigma]|nr:hypothetical protein SEA_STIGMA_144 [Streptomyces phage Stigma]